MPAEVAPWCVASVIGLVVVLLVLGISADFAMLAAAVALAVAGLITPAQAASGFSNEGMLTVALLYVVVAGLQSTAAIRRMTGSLFRPVANEKLALLRLCVPVAAASAFLNNTPIVAVLIPVVTDWAKRSRIPVSRLLMPLSYATILGGTITLIGTSTNLVVMGLVREASAKPSPMSGLRAIGFFELAWVGVPLAIVGISYIILLNRTLLPVRTPVIDIDEDARQYTSRVRVVPGGPLVGLTIEQAGLRGLPGLFIVGIERGDDRVSAPGPETVLRANDIVVFAGVLEMVRELIGTRGFVAADKPNSHQFSGTLIEVVVSTTFPGLGQSIRDFGFRGRYDAAVLAVARNGHRIEGKIGDVVLEPGDTLLVDADHGFIDRWRDSRDFYLVGKVDGETTPSHDRAWIAIVILASMVGYATWRGDMLGAAALAAGAMLLFRCVTPAQARGSLDLPTLITIAASLGISKAVESTGLGRIVGEAFVTAAGGQPVLTVAATYLATMVFTAFVSNSAAAAIMFPIALGTAASIGGDPMPYVMSILFAASADFATPIGYQTNLMVYGPGGYRFTDYLRFGLPLNAIACATTTVVLGWQYGLY
ncbi:MAG: SLC13 family permease [Phycisphaerae bacterium]|nr:SLC13 family permease [Phycisphaerae bacterium]